MTPKKPAKQTVKAWTIRCKNKIVPIAFWSPHFELGKVVFDTKRQAQHFLDTKWPKSIVREDTRKDLKIVRVEITIIH